LVYGYDGGSVLKQSEISFSGINGAATDLAGLREGFDGNHDGYLDLHDAQYNNFGLWQDNNADGKVEQDEYHTLSQLGITGINLTSDNHQTTQNGSIIYGMGTYETAEGHTFSIADAALATLHSSPSVDSHDNSAAPASSNAAAPAPAPTPVVTVDA